MSVSASRKLAAVAVPWVFLAAFATLYALLVIPRVREGNIIAVCVGVVVTLVFVVFLVAAITFSRDVLLNRWP
jgi:hypothetical protein